MESSSLHHSGHTSHTAGHTATRHSASASSALRRWHISDHSLARGQQSCDARGIDNPCPRDLCRVNDPCLEHVAVNAILCVETHLDGSVWLHKLAAHHRSLLTRVLYNRCQRRLQRSLDDLHPDPLVHVLCLLSHLVQLRGAVQQGLASARYNALLDRSPCGVECVHNPILLLVYLNFGCSSHLDHSHASRELGEAFLQLLTLVVRLSRVDTSSDELAPFIDECLVASAIEDNGVIFGNLDALACAELFGSDILDLHPNLLGDHSAAREDGEVLHG
mmetsp:Transcript_5328/g.13327  ORF Transcript_5328/g.13327 Transcript_5328/m.13327 type:complete len:276 (+) Transcript_5328:132-959(+)